MGRVTYTTEFESPVAPARLFKASVLHMHDIATKITPAEVKSASISHGDGGVGTVKEYHFTDAVPFKLVKERVDALDKENHYVKYTMLEGGSLGLKYKAASHAIKFEPAANGGCVCKVLAEIETLDGVEYTEEEKNKAKQGTLETYKAVEAYLLANPNEFA